MLQSSNGERQPLVPGAALDVRPDGNGGVRLAPREANGRLASVVADGREAWLDVVTAEPTTCVNGRPVRRKARLLAGDRICFGDACLDVIGSEPGRVSDADPVSVYALRRRGGVGSGSMMAGGLIHLDRQGEPVSAAAGVVGFVLADGAVYLDPGDAEVRVNGHRVGSEVLVADGDNIQVGRQRYTLEAQVSHVLQMPDPLHDADLDVDVPTPPVKRSQTGLAWLVAAAAAAAAVISALLYFSGGA